MTWRPPSKPAAVQWQRRGPDRYSAEIDGVAVEAVRTRHDGAYWWRGVTPWPDRTTLDLCARSLERVQRALVRAVRERP